MNELKTCSLCNSVMGDVVEGKRIRLTEQGICTVCLEELQKLEGKYRMDFEARTGREIKYVIPWPAFRDFTWPPYHAVITSGWQFHKHEFGMAFTDDTIFAGRRSIQSFEDDALATMAELHEQLEVADDPGERVRIRRELQKWQRRLDKVEELLRQGERPLFSIPMDIVRAVRRAETDEWIQIGMSIASIKTKFFGGKKEAMVEEYFVVSQIYRPAIDYLTDELKRFDVPVETVRVKEIPAHLKKKLI